MLWPELFCGFLFAWGLVTSKWFVVSDLVGKLLLLPLLGLTYGSAFLLYQYLLARKDVSYLAPMTSAFTNAFSVGFGVLLFKEWLSPIQWFGLLMIFLGLSILKSRGFTSRK